MILPVRFMQTTDKQQYLYKIDWKNAGEEVRHQYIRFLYDRQPVLPTKLIHTTILDECITALISRLTGE